MFRIPGETPDFGQDENRPLFVTSGYLAGHFRTRVHAYASLQPTRYFQCSKFPFVDLLRRDYVCKNARSRPQKKKKEAFNVRKSKIILSRERNSKYHVNGE